MDLVIEKLSAADRLFIRLAGEPDAPIHWWLEGNTALSGELAHCGELNQLTSIADKVCVVAVVPVGCFLFRQVKFAGQLNRRTRQALTFMLEPSVLTDVEQLHSLVLAQDGQDILLGAVARQLMTQWLDGLHQAGIQISGLYPDALLLPANSTVQWQSGWLIHQFGQGFYLTDEWLPLLAERELECYGTVPAIAEYWREQPPREIASLWSQTLKESCPVNWLQADFKPRWQQKVGRILPLSRRGLSICSALVLLLGGLQFGINGWQQHRMAEIVQQRSDRLYQQMFATTKTPQNVRRSASMLIDWLQQQHDIQGFLPFLQTMQPVFQQYPTVQLTDIAYQREEMKAQLTVRVKNQTINKAFMAELARQTAVVSDRCEPAATTDGELQCLIRLDLS
jgi:general secretion pathway protein L